jgi:hypothetical protein
LNLATRSVVETTPNTQEITMKRSTFLKLAAGGALAAAALATAGPSLAQTATSSSTSAASSAGTLSTATVGARRPSANATPDMINEAIQRSQARAAKFQQQDIPEKFGSEEPFTYNPAVKNFSASQQ